MPAYNPEQDVVVRELLVAQSGAHEELVVRVRRYDSADGTPGKAKKLEVSRWRVLKSGERKVKAGFRLTQREAQAVLAALLDLELESVVIDEDWNVEIK